jgi:putative endonuclease
MTYSFTRHPSEGWGPDRCEKPSASFSWRALQSSLFAMGGWVYILASQRNGTLNVGVTADLPARIHQHRDGLAEGFTKRHGVTTLVHVERFDTIQEAISREKALKAWKRAWKLKLIEADNPEWRDLWLDINA